MITRNIYFMYRIFFITICTANLHLAEELEDETDFNTLLHTHVYDMCVGIMRALISNAAAPPDTISSENFFTF